MNTLMTEELTQYRNDYLRDLYPEWWSLHKRICKIYGAVPPHENVYLPSKHGAENYCENLKYPNGKLFMSSGALNPMVGVFGDNEVIKAIDSSISNGWEMTFIFGDCIMLNNDGINPFVEFLLDNDRWESFILKSYIPKNAEDKIPFHAKIVNSDVTYEEPHNEFERGRTRYRCEVNRDIEKIVIDYYENLESIGRIKRIKHKEDILGLKRRIYNEYIDNIF